MKWAWAQISNHGRKLITKAGFAWLLTFLSALTGWSNSYSPRHRLCPEPCPDFIPTGVPFILEHHLPLHIRSSQSPSSIKEFKHIFNGGEK